MKRRYGLLSPHSLSQAVLKQQINDYNYNQHTEWGDNSKYLLFGQLQFSLHQRFKKFLTMLTYSKYQQSKVEIECGNSAQDQCPPKISTIFFSLLTFSSLPFAQPEISVEEEAGEERLKTHKVLISARGEAKKARMGLDQAKTQFRPLSVAKVDKIVNKKIDNLR